ncbi:hypothetical protein D9M71_543620 [compost metagenome]
MPPIRVLARLLPTSTSLKLLPVRFSMLIRVSLPEPPVAWAVVLARLTLMALVANAYETVSLPTAPLRTLLPVPANSTLLRALPVPFALPVASRRRFSTLLPRV